MALVGDISGSNRKSSRIGITGSVVFAGADPDHASSFPNMGTDVAFYVSGNIGGKNSATEQGVAVFQGDTVVTGALYGSTVIVGDSTSQQPTTTALNVYTNASGDYAALIDNDHATQGHGLKVTTDGSTSATNAFDVELGSTTFFRVRADGRVGIGKVTALPQARLTIDGSSLGGDNADMSIAGKIMHLGDSNTHLTFGDDQISLTAGGRVFVQLDETDSHDQVLILSGGAASSTNAAAAEDVTFYVSGSKINWGGTPYEGVSLIDGDLIISGTARPENLRVDGNMMFGYNPGGSVGTATFMNGLTGSLTKLPSGGSYLIAGSNISITSASNGAVTIAASGGGSGGSPGGSSGDLQYKNSSGDFAGISNSDYSSGGGYEVLTYGGGNTSEFKLNTFKTHLTGALVMSASSDNSGVYVPTRLLINTGAGYFRQATFSYGGSTFSSPEYPTVVIDQDAPQGDWKNASTTVAISLSSGSNSFSGITSQEQGPTLQFMRASAGGGAVAGGGSSAMGSTGEGAQLGRIDSFGHDGHGKYIKTTAITFVTTGAVDDTDVQGKIIFAVNKGSDTDPHRVMAIGPSSSVYFGDESGIPAEIHVGTHLKITGSTVGSGHNEKYYGVIKPDGGGYGNLILSGTAGGMGWGDMGTLAIQGDTYISGALKAVNAVSGAGGSSMIYMDPQHYFCSRPYHSSNEQNVFLPKISDLLGTIGYSGGPGAWPLTLYQYGDGATVFWSQASAGEFFYSGSASNNQYVLKLDTAGSSVDLVGMYPYGSSNGVWLVVNSGSVNH